MAGTSFMPLQLSHIGPLGLKWGAQERGPTVDLGLERFDYGARVLVEAPYEHGGASAGDRRSERTELARAAGELIRAREQVRAAFLVQTVREAASDQIPIATSQPECEQRTMGDIEDGLLERHELRQRAARLAGAHGLVRHNGDRLETGWGLEAHRLAVGTNDKAPMERRGDVIGVTLQGGGTREQVDIELEQVASREQTGDNR